MTDINTYIYNNRNCSTSDAKPTLEHIEFAFNKYVDKLFGENSELKPTFILTESNKLNTEFVALPNGKNYILYEWNFAYLISTFITWIESGSLESFRELQIDSIINRVGYLLNENNPKTAILLFNLQRHILINKTSETDFYNFIDKVSSKYNCIDTDIAKVRIRNVLNLIPPEADTIHFNNEIFVLYHEVSHCIFNSDLVNRKEVLKLYKEKCRFDLDYLQISTNLETNKILEIIDDNLFIEEIFCDEKALNDNYNSKIKYEDKVYALISAKLTFNALFLYSFIDKQIKDLDNIEVNTFEQLVLRKAICDKLCDEKLENEKVDDMEFYLLYKSTKKFIDLNFSFIKDFFTHFLRTLKEIQNSNLIDIIPNFENPKEIFNRMNLFKSYYKDENQYNELKNQVIEFNETDHLVYFNEKLFLLHCIPNEIINNYKVKLNELKSAKENTPPTRYWQKKGWEPWHER